MNIIDYAVEIDTGTTITDANIGLLSGVLRYITGRPRYTETYVPTWASGEIYSGFNTYTWYEGFIVKDGVNNPTRSIDISNGGDYGIGGSFSFKIRNNNLYWKTIKDNGINLTGKTVRVWVVIEDKFYQIWGGCVTDIDRNTTEYEIKCSDNSAISHKDVATTTPMIIGNIEYVKAEKSKVTVYVPLVGSSTVAPLVGAIEYRNDSAQTLSGVMLDDNAYWDISLMVKDNTFTTNQLSGNYLRIARYQDNVNDLDGPRTANTDNMLYVYGSTANQLLDEIEYITVQVKQAPTVEPPFTSGNELTTYYCYTQQDDNLRGISDYIMYCSIVNLNNTYTVGQSGVGLNLTTVYSYDDKTNTYSPLPVQTRDNGDGSFDISVASNINGESFSYYYPLDFDIASARIFCSGALTTSRTQTGYNTTGFNGQIEYHTDGTISGNVSGLVSNFLDADFLPLGPFNGYMELNSETATKDIPGIIISNISGILTSSGEPSANHRDYTFSGVLVSGQIFNTDLLSNGAIYDAYITLQPNNFNFNQLVNTLTNKTHDLTPAYTWGQIYNSHEANDYNLVNLDLDLIINSTITTDDDIYVMLDYNLSGLWERVDRPFVMESRWQVRDKWGKLYTYDNSGVYGQSIQVTATGDYNYNFYGLGEGYYLDNPTLALHTNICALDNYFSKSVAVNNTPDFTIADHLEDDYAPDWGYNAYKLPDEIRDLIANQIAYSVKASFLVYADTGWLTNFRLAYRQVGVLVKRTQSFDSTLYVSSSIPSYSGLPSNTVYGAFKYLLEGNDGISNVNYGNLQAQRSSGSYGVWEVGKQINSATNSKTLLKDLAAQSYVAIYPDRKGRLKFNCWLENSAYTSHDSNIILRDSISNISLTPVSNIYNNFLLGYDYNNATSKYNKELIVTNTDVTLPASGGTWNTCVSGIASYAIASGIFNTAHSGYLAAGVRNNPASDITQLSWFISNSDNDHNSPVLYLIQLVNWTTKQHMLCSYSIPMESGIYIDLTDQVYLKDYLYTGNADYAGYVDSLEYDISNDKVNIHAFFLE